MSLYRTILRNNLKNYLGTNKIQTAWRRLQIKRYGFKRWLHRYHICGGEKQL
jgi:hypothetical protein